MVQSNVLKEEIDLINQMDKIEPSDPSIQKNYLQFRVDITKQAIASLKERIPLKILHFNRLVNVNETPGSVLHVTDLDRQSFSFNGFDGVPVDGASTDVVNDETGASTGKKIKLSDGRDGYTHYMPHHKQIVQELEKIKIEAAELIEMVGNIKLWIQLNVPRIEDGNNFGVGIQEEAIQELARVEDSAFNLFDSIVKYYMARAKLSCKIIKYPNVCDYQEAVRELDEKEWLHSKITKVDMRNNYSMLYDLLSKNWEKVVKPKNEDSGHRMVF
ncbi:putative subunit of proteaseome activator complex [Cardiosporidium cionae]|uniref:Subunit of proteaseome activator complex n=1 Tax=Cardiosporidium cionae TaxID=476202 RepID=A0ABQ7J9H6_9APIC|nr:putative subunit of proteaseome activator complex [Cardiosporidium cionae]|eukprot:KAF8820589.1 putative subunit of proteaseome activator complex [Cardiosporidium cionae]